jgi:hypothetical protein
MSENWRPAKADNGTWVLYADHLKEMERLREALLECRDYFSDRADADHNGERFIPNSAMRMLQMIDAALLEAQKEGNNDY